MITRDSIVLTLTALVALFTYLISAGKPPTQWSYMEWLQFGSFLVAWLAGKLSSSALAGEKTPLSQTKPALGGLFSVKED